MTEYSLYMTIAGVSTGLFLIKTAMMFFGTDFDGGDFDFDADGDFDGTDSFNLLSVQSILAFFMMFGWTALSLRFEYAYSFLTTLLGGTAAGIGGAFLSAALLKYVKKFNSKPLPDKVSLGAKGQVYLPITTDGIGEIKVVHNGAMRHFKAKSQSGERIRANQEVEVVSNDSEILVVNPVNGGN